MSDVLILTRKEVESCLSMKRTIDAVREAYIAFANGRVQMPPVMHLDVGKYNGEVDIKSGFVEDFNLIGTKIASGYYDNHKLGLPPGMAVIVLLDLKTSMPLAIMDGSYITAYRTGAAGAVAASVLARKDSTKIGIIGAGTQGRMQVLALRELFQLEEIRVWDIEERMATKYSTEMAELLGISVKHFTNREEVVRGSDIVVTVTPSKKALVNKDWIERGMHINAIGADGPGKQELDPGIMKLADKVVVDSLAQCKRIGEIQHALALGLIKEQDVHGEIGEILIGKKVGRESDNEITLFDSTGLAAQDIAAAHVVLEAAKEKKLGYSTKLMN
ncbi:MAG: ornithine cyclodeaminase family protein [Candidatus Thorarchaeota archaeon]|nr:MAG: ornithine cyclodeaminase family protein [Candidatus Thorarchaeota archaeon]